jgi:hypothetical protein
MKKLVLAAALAASSLALSPARAADPQITVWGFESWACGNRWYKIKLGSGKDVRLLSIQGAVTGSPLQSADIGASTIRQSLISILNEVDRGKPPNAAVTESPQGDDRFNNSVDRHIAQINVKQSGRSMFALPVSYQFPAPIRVPKGELSALIFTETYAVNPERKVQDVPSECLNTEVHLTLTFEEVQ